jgi:predicted  nucleic acid-binding Zn-ribbon protein
MSQLQALLSYQQIDQKLFKIDNDLAKSESYQKYAKLRKFLKAAPEKVDALEAKAAALKAETAELAKQYEQVESTLGDYENLEELVSGGADISFYKKNVQTIVEKLKKLKADISALEASIKETGEEYQKLKKQVISAQKQYAEAEENYKAVEASKKGEKDAILAELAEAEKAVSPELIARYKTKRKEKLFPVVGELYSGRCPFCSMEPPIVAKSNLASGIECDNCHRIIFEK